MSYEYKKTERLVRGRLLTVSLEEGEMAYHVRFTNDGVVTTLYVQAKGKQTCTWFAQKREGGLEEMSGEMMNTAHNLYEHAVERLNAM